MKKVFKKSLSSILALLIFCMAIVPTLAQSDMIEKDCPHINVFGFMAQDVFVDKDDPDSETAWPLSTGAILKTVAKLILPITELAYSGDWSAFADDLVPPVDELFEPVSLDFSGEISNTSGIRFEYPEKEEITKDSDLLFSYDWRLDPLATAAELNDFIDYVLDASGCDEVTISCHSLGGIITLSYLKLYGDEKVRSVAFNSTAIYGETYTGDMLSGKISFDDEAVKCYLDFAFDGMSAESLLSMLTGMLTDAGVVKFVTDYGNEILDAIFDKVAMTLMRVFANWPTIWAMTPDDMLADAEKYVFDGVYTANNVDYSGLKDKIDNYNSKVRLNKTETLKQLNKTTNVYVISRYGYSSLPLTPSWENMSDGVVDSKNTSFGATIANYGETLDVAQTEYVSPDQTIDASTCLFPEQTWFIKGIKHSDMADCLDIFMEQLLYYDGQATVDTFDEYPRFMVYDFENGIILPDDGVENLSAFDKFIAFLEKIIKFIMSIIK